VTRRVIFTAPDFWTDPPPKKQENPVSEIFGVSPSPRTILLDSIEGITAAYGHTNDGVDYVGIYIEDGKIGEAFIPLSFAAAAQLVADIAGILAQRDDLRRRYDDAGRRP